ncbi:MAG: hypothetical protein R8G66_09855 [Cytophagales bacterium]|nr:hypothetical protein [Cytophagales bacterium]
MKTLKIIRSLAWKICAFSLFLISSCSSEDEPEIVFNPIELNSFSAIDIGNIESSTDIQVKFNFSEGVEAINLFIVPASTANNLTTEQLQAVPEGSFLAVQGVTATKNEYEFQLPDLLDMNSNTLQHDLAYVVVLMFNIEGKSFIAERKASITLTDKSTILGRYVGTWDDNLFSNVPVSFWLREQQGSRVSGDFYISSTFQPAYGGEDNDGTITVLLSEDGTNTFTFQYRQDLPDYMGGCPGAYTGEGQFETLRVAISFTGEDCDGVHEDGSIQVERSY